MNIEPWSKQIEAFLTKIRKNSILLSEKHKLNYYAYKQFNHYFEIPILVLSSISSPLSIGGQSYMSQNTISVVICGIGIVIAIITSVKLYLNINDVLDREDVVARGFYNLSVDIFRVLSIPYSKRNTGDIDYLNEVYGQYIKLLEQSSLLRKRFKQDQLILDIDDIVFTDDSSSDGSLTPRVELRKLPQVRSTFPMSIPPYNANKTEIDEIV